MYMYIHIYMYVHVYLYNLCVCFCVRVVCVCVCVCDDAHQEMHKQLSDQSDWIDQLAQQMQSYVAASPHSPVCQELLNQVQQVTTPSDAASVYSPTMGQENSVHYSWRMFILSANHLLLGIHEIRSNF